jgi:hypothetical protein
MKCKSIALQLSSLIILLALVGCGKVSELTSVKERSGFNPNDKVFVFVDKDAIRLVKKGGVKEPAIIRRLIKETRNHGR